MESEEFIMKKFIIKGQQNFETINLDDVSGGYGNVREFPFYEWDDLDGKTLLIRVTEDDNGVDAKCKTICGYDAIDGITYVLATKLSECNVRFILN